MPDEAVTKRLPRFGWLPFAGVYAAYGATFGVLGGGAPLVLRAHGMALAQVGLLQLIYAPIGVAFLWAPLLDRYGLPRLPHRLGWIGAGMIATALLLAALGASATWPVWAIFIVAMAVSVTITTSDIALEALVVETVPRERRAALTTAKLVSLSLGTMVGVELATALPDTLSLSAALVVVAALVALLALPLVLVHEPRRARAAAASPRPAGSLRLLVRRAALLGAFYVPAILIITVPSLVLLDLHVSLPAVGFFTGTLTTTTGVAMTLAAGALMKRMPAHRIVAWLTAGVAATSLLLALAAALGAPRFGYTMATVLMVFEGGLGVPIFTIVYRWAEGEHAATDYAVLFGIAFLISFPVRVAAPMLAAAIGWPSYFLVAVPLYVVACAALVLGMRETPVGGAA
ncbi:Major facilitator transporter [Beijerinckiaceae bacterium RH AL1]|nr:Major facilitator transporter [Beijerinckiaceae bacterium RH CH11]VVB44532.1 Major facilitator transporter [Beijerinckiaceae bacterium RH AL8]VVC54361.1 Major facilitator transporter [Beijerinckiaceae bacterium RH AL1]